MHIKIEFIFLKLYTFILIFKLLNIFILQNLVEYFKKSSILKTFQSGQIECTRKNHFL